MNFRCVPEVVENVLPPPFRPKLVQGWGVAGICLIRLRRIHPAFMPSVAGLTSENAAHRIAVEWNENGITRQGVFIPRRDTNSLLNRLAGGKIFPGTHHAAHFRVWEQGDRLEAAMRSDDGKVFVRVLANIPDLMPRCSVFGSIAEASESFQNGALGWSTGSSAGEYDGLELRCAKWRIEPLHVENIESSFFDNRGVFPPGSVEFDSAFLLRNVPHEWHTRGRLTIVPRQS